MKHTLLILITILFSGCSSSKKVMKLITSGNYDQAITTSIKKIQKNKTKKSSQPHISLLNEAFKKATEKDTERISYLKLEGGGEHYEEIFQLYNNLKDRQNKIKPLLPLYYNGQKINFNFKDYQKNIVTAKHNLVDYLYITSVKQLKNTISKEKIRKIYDDLSYLDKLNPNYKNVKSLLREVHDKGTDFILVSIKNETNKILPIKLENELLAFDTYGLDNFWRVYDSSRKTNKQVYDYRMELIFRNITISPERVKERNYIKEKEVEEKTIVKDSLGKEKEIIKIKKVNYHLYKIHQEKFCNIDAKVNYIDNKTEQLLEDFPLQSTFVFKHTYGPEGSPKPFPSDEQMVYDTEKDLKEKLKKIISNTIKSY